MRRGITSPVILIAKAEPERVDRADRDVDSIEKGERCLSVCVERKRIEASHEDPKLDSSRAINFGQVIYDVHVQDACKTS